VSSSLIRVTTAIDARRRPLAACAPAVGFAIALGLGAHAPSHGFAAAAAIGLAGLVAASKQASP
jgi:hypothetical protein